MYCPYPTSHNIISVSYCRGFNIIRHLATCHKYGTVREHKLPLREQKMHLLGKLKGDFLFLKTYFLSTLAVKYFMRPCVEWLRGAACKEVFTPL